MRKFVLFISTLFVFLIPRVSAEVFDGNLFVDFRTPGVTPEVPLIINRINSQCTTESMCTELADSLGHIPTYFELYEHIISLLNEQDLYYILILSHTNYSNGNKVPRLKIIVLDRSYYDIDSSNFKLDFYSSSSNYLYYQFAYNNNINLNVWQSLDGDTTWNYNSVINQISQYKSSSTQLPSFLSFIYDKEANAYYPDTSMIYYTNIPFTYNLSQNGVEYSFTYFSDFYGAAADSITFTTGLGPATNRNMFLRSYVSQEIFDEGKEPDPDEPTPPSTSDTIIDTDIGGAESSFGEFFGNFETDDHGLYAIISTPLNFIKSFLTKTCTPLVLPLPFVNQDVTLPCMEYVYSTFFGNFFIAYQTITTGIISYWFCINIFRIVKNLKDSDNDTIEVLDL